MPALDQEISVPLPPEWVVAGDPAPQMVLKTISPCGRQKAGTWTCQTSIFDYHFTYHETIIVLEGELDVEEPERSYRLVPGEFGHFPKGLKARWNVKGPFKKYFFAITDSGGRPEETP